MSALSMLAVVGLVASVGGPKDSADRASAVVDSIAVLVQQEGRVAGFSVAIGRSGKVEFAAGYGVADLREQTPARSDTVYPIASISKHVTAALILALVHDGRLSLRDSVADWIPDLPASVDWTRVEIRHLLTHTAGIFDIARASEDEVSDGVHDREALMDVLSARQLEFEPGTARRYSNSGFHLLGEVASRVAGESYFRALQQRVLGPARMQFTAPTGDSYLPGRRAASYWSIDEDFEEHTLWETLPGASDGYAVPAGFLQATAADLVRLEMALERGEVFSKALLEEMRSPTELRNGIEVQYGLGTRLGSVKGRRKVGHTGGFGSYRSALASYPEEDLTIAVLLNTDLGRDAHYEAATIERAIAAALLAGSDQGTGERVPREEVREYAGVYQSQGGEVVEVEVRGGEVFIRRADSLDGPYKRVGERQFSRAEWPPDVWSIEFGETEDGRTRVLGSDSGWCDEWQLVRVGDTRRGAAGEPSVGDLEGQSAE